MTVQYLSTTELQRSASAATVAFSHTAPAGQKGILVGFVRGLTSGAISAVSYGGTNLVQYARATDTANEPGAAEWWYAPHTTTGAQNVSYNQGSPGSQVHVVVVSVGGDATPYVQASQTQSENTASLSVSLTTGYVSGLAFGALYWGGSSPGDVTLGANQTLVHDWDMGAYGSKVTRSTDPTSSGTYYHTGGGDDVAFAVVFLTDGTIAAGTPQTASIPTVAGHAPSLVLGEPVEATALPGVGSVTVAGRVPVSTAYITPPMPADLGEAFFPRLTDGMPTWARRQVYGGAALVGRQPTVVTEVSENVTAIPGTGAVAVAGRAPALVGERLITPNVGGATVAGQTPALGSELTVSPGAGAASVAGRAPSLSTEAVASPAQGSVQVQGRQPALVPEGAVAPSSGTISAEGRAPVLSCEAIALPGSGAVVAEGRAPEIVTQTEVLGTATPDVGAVAVAGQAPALSTETVAEPSSGNVAAAGRSPGLLTERTITPILGEISIAVLSPILPASSVTSPAQSAVAVAGRAPTLLTEVTITPSVGAVGAVGQLSYISTTGVAAPGASAASAVGQAPSLATAIAVTPTATAVTVEGRAVTLAASTDVFPAAGTVTAAGRQATLYTERAVAPGVGYARTSAEPPALVEEGAAVAQPAPAATSMAGLAPELLTERRIDPELGAVALLGRLPTVGYEIVGTVRPDAGAVSAEGLAPTVVPASEELAGRLIRRGRKRIPRYAEESVSAGPVVHTSPELRPDPPAHFTVPLSALGGVDTSQIAARIQRLEAQARRRARQRREEEEIVQFLMKVA